MKFLKCEKVQKQAPNFQKNHTSNDKRIPKILNLLLIKVTKKMSKVVGLPGLGQAINKVLQFLILRSVEKLIITF